MLRVPVSGPRWIGRVLLIVAAGMAVAMNVCAAERQGTEAEIAVADEQAASAYDHLLFVVSRRAERGVVDDLILQWIPRRNEIDQPFDKLRRVVRTQPGGLRGIGNSTSFLGVFGGHLLMLRGGRVEAIDLETGDLRELTETRWEVVPEDAGRSPPPPRQFVWRAHLEGDRLFLLAGYNTPTTPTSVVEVNLTSLERRNLYEEPAGSPRQTFPFGTIYPRLVISPEGERLAIAAVMPGGQDALPGERKSSVTVIERNQGEPAAHRIPQDFRIRLELGGGGDHLHTPIIGWHNRDTLLIISLPPDASPMAAGLQTLASANGPYVLQAWNAKTKQLTKVGPLPETKGARGGEPHFWRRPGGDLLLHIPELGDHEVDLQWNVFSRTTRLADAYSLKGHPDVPALLHQDAVIGVMAPHCRMALAPDGRQVAWLPWILEQRGPTTFGLGPVPLLVHSAESGTRTVMTGQFDSLNITGSGPEPPVSSHSTAPILWVRSTQLVRSPRFTP
jgi:hypothetical protein